MNTKQSKINPQTEAPELRQLLADLQAEVSHAQVAINDLQAQFKHMRSLHAGASKLKRSDRRAKERDLRRADNNRSHEKSQARIAKAYSLLLSKLGRRPFIKELARAASCSFDNAFWFLDALEEIKR